MHPDADVLSAFAEGALAEHERLACLNHLAACAQCREIVYLTQAAEAGDAEPVMQPVAPPAPFWKRWLKPVSVLSTAAVAALVAISIFIYRPQARRAPQPELMAKVEAPPAAVPAPVEGKIAPPATARSGAVHAKASPAMKVAPPPGPPLPQSAPQGTAPAAPMPAPPVTNQLSGLGGAVTDSAGEAAPHAQAQLGFKQTQNEIHLQPAQVARADSALPVGTASETVAVTAEAGDVLTFGAGGGSAGRGGRGLRAGAALSAAPVAPGPTLLSVTGGSIMLRTDASGALSRSADAGKSWQRVKSEWQGRIVRLATPPDAPGAGDAVFQLNTDAGEVWFSRDGSQWTAASDR
jgi:hypothetical protein